MSPYQSLSFEGAPGPVVFADAMHKLFAVDLAVEQQDFAAFHSQITAYSGRLLRFAALRFSPHLTRSQQFLRPTRWLVTLQREGVAYVAQGGRSSEIRAGDLFMIDPARPFSIETEHIYTQSMYVEPDSLRRLIPEADALTATAVSCSGGAARVLANFVDELFASANTLDEFQADHLANALPFMLGAAFSSTARQLATAPSRLRALHRQRVSDYLRDNLRDSALDANSVAQAVGLSTRYLYELFAGDKESLMKRVWSQRLEQCRSDLSSPTLAARSIGEIAYSWGFNDVAHFSRSFKQRYGVAPREFRRVATLKPCTPTISPVSE